MDFLQNATDDQIALMGCFVALMTSAALMYLSVFLNRTHRKTQLRKDLPHSFSVADHSAQPVKEDSRKVA